MSSMLGKDKLVLDVTALSDSDNVGAFVRSLDGSVITDHEIISSEYANLVAQGLIFQSKLPGAIGNTYSFEVIDSGGAGPIAFTEVAGAIVVDLVGLTPTKAQVVTLLSTSTYADVSLGTPTAGNVVVAAAQSFANGSDASVHNHLDVYSATADGYGNPITSTGGALDVNLKSPLTVEVDLDGIYNAGSNPTPDNVGLIGSTRNAAGLANQTLQFTGAGVGSDDVATANIVAQDVNSFGMIWDSVGGSWDRAPGNSTDGLFVKVTNAISVAGDVADDDVDSGNPIKVGSRSEWGVLPAISADLDRADLISDKFRRVYVNNGANIAVKATAATVTDTASVVVATNLDGRRQLNLQNLGNKAIYVGDSAVSIASGLRVAAGATLTIELGADVSLYAITETGASMNARVFELA